jgi:hypothetical protein
MAAPFVPWRGPGLSEMGRTSVHSLATRGQVRVTRGRGRGL